MKKIVVLVLILTMSITLFGCINGPKAPTPTAPTPNSTEKTDSNIYTNDQYGFTFTLPDGWKEYSVVTAKWEGRALGGSQDGKIIEQGTVITLRHPQWTDKNPRQDIPIMVFTVGQWDLVKQEKISVGAAPMGPKELARNSKYIFALPARYNYAFPLGYEEVEDILEGNPLRAK